MFQNDLSVGEPAQTGQATYDSNEQTYRITGSGENIWFDRLLNDLLKFDINKTQKYDATMAALDVGFSVNKVLGAARMLARTISSHGPFDL